MLVSTGSSPVVAASAAAMQAFLPAQDPLVLELVKGVPTALVTLLVGGLATYIAWRQYKVAEEQRRVAHAKLNLELFQRRYEIFEHTWAMLSSMIQPRDDQTGVEAAFSNARPRAQFLFGEDVAEYMAEISRRVTEQAAIMRRTERVTAAMRPEDSEAYSQNGLFFFEQASSGAREVFGRYLDFSRWR